MNQPYPRLNGFWTTDQELPMVERSKFVGKTYSGKKITVNTYLKSDNLKSIVKLLRKKAGSLCSFLNLDKIKIEERTLAPNYDVECCIKKVNDLFLLTLEFFPEEPLILANNCNHIFCAHLGEMLHQTIKGECENATSHLLGGNWTFLTENSHIEIKARISKNMGPNLSEEHNGKTSKYIADTYNLFCNYLPLLQQYKPIVDVLLDTAAYFEKNCLNVNSLSESTVLCNFNISNKQEDESIINYEGNCKNDIRLSEYFENEKKIIDYNEITPLLLAYPTPRRDYSSFVFEQVDRPIKKIPLLPLPSRVDKLSRNQKEQKQVINNISSLKNITIIKDEKKKKNREQIKAQILSQNLNYSKKIENEKYKAILSIKKSNVLYFEFLNLNDKPQKKNAILIEHKTVQETSQINEISSIIIPKLPTLSNELVNIHEYGKLRGVFTSSISRSLLIDQNKITYEQFPLDIVIIFAKIFFQDVIKNDKEARKNLSNFELVSRRWWKASSSFITQYEEIMLPNDFAAKCDIFPKDISKLISTYADQSVGVYQLNHSDAIHQPSTDAVSSALPFFCGFHEIYDTTKPKKYPYLNFEVKYFKHPEFSWATGLVDFISWTMIENFSLLYIEDPLKRPALAMPYTFQINGETDGKGVFILQRFRVDDNNKEWWLFIDKPFAKHCTEAKVVCFLQDYDRDTKLLNKTNCIGQELTSRNYIEWLDTFLMGQVCEDLPSSTEGYDKSQPTQRRIKHYIKNQ